MSRFEEPGTAAVFAQVRPDLLRYLSRYTGDADLAEDVVQETWLRLHEHPPADAGSLRGWFFTVATNLARDAARTDRRRERLTRTRQTDVPRPAPEPDPGRTTERAELRARVRAALDTLSEKERTTLLMREEGFTHREIAAAVGTTTKSVGTLIARALGKMAHRLDPEDFS